VAYHWVNCTICLPEACLFSAIPVIAKVSGCEGGVKCTCLNDVYSAPGVVSESFEHRLQPQAPPSTVSSLLSAWARSDVGRSDSAAVQRLALLASDRQQHRHRPGGTVGGEGAADKGSGGLWPTGSSGNKYEATFRQQLAALAGRQAAHAVCR
jgi:hypothetical protein